MKKTILLFLASLFLITATPAQAETSTGSAVREKVKQEVAEKVAATRQKMLTEFVARTVKRLKAHLDRADKLVTRVQSRIDKLKEKGADTTKAQAQLDSTKAKIAASRADVAKFEADAPGIISANQPKDAFALLKTRIQTLKKELVDIHTNLASSLGLVKGLNSEAKEKEGTESAK